MKKILAITGAVFVAIAVAYTGIVGYRANKKINEHIKKDS